MVYDIDMFMNCGEKIYLKDISETDRNDLDKSLAGEEDSILINDRYRIYKNHISFVKYAEVKEK